MVISRSGTCHGGAESDSNQSVFCLHTAELFFEGCFPCSGPRQSLILCVSAGVLEIVMLLMISKHPSGPGATILPLYQLSNEPLAALTSRTQSSGGLLRYHLSSAHLYHI